MYLVKLGGLYSKTNLNNGDIKKMVYGLPMFILNVMVQNCCIKNLAQQIVLDIIYTLLKAFL